MAMHAHTAKKPAHVPLDAVYDFDYHRDEGLLVDPHERILELIKQAPPLFWTPHNGGHWMALGYNEAFRVMREHETFSSSLMPPDMAPDFVSGFKLPDGRRIPRMTPIFMDPPEHTKMRAPLQRVFAPRTVMKLTGDIEVLAASLVDAVAPQGSCDFLSAVIEQLPVRIFLRIMGLPQDRIEEFRALVRIVFEPEDDGPMARVTVMRRIGDAMLEQILDRRSDPRDDLISLLWSVEVDGEPMTLDLMEDYCSLLFIAGLDTVINAMAHGVRHLAANSGLQAELRARPELIADATEELLRRYTISAPMRRATRDTELSGRTIQRNEIVVAYLSAADLDGHNFPEPAKVDVARENKTHLIFGAGPHRCLGSHLARIEINALYRVILNKLPEFRLDPEKRPVFHAGNMLAVTSLPIIWD